MSSTLPDSIHAIRIHQTGGADKLIYDTLPVPTPGARQLLVAVAYCGVNYIDTYHRTGLYPLPLPAVLGREGSGVVVSLGSEINESKEFSIGDRIVFMQPGSYSNYLLVDAAVAIKIPSSISLKYAASMWLQGLTAHYLTHSSYPIQKGDYVLIHAAAGGTGSLIVQFAKQRGGIVIATAGTPEKVDIVKKLGADHVILYTKDNFREEVMKITGGKGVSAVYDGVGKSTWELSLKSLRPLGYLILFGNASGPVPPIDPLLLSSQGSIFLTRPTLVHYIANRSILEQRSSDLFSAVESGALTPKIGAEFPLEKSADAHRLLESRESTGKIILVVNDKLQ